MRLFVNVNLYVICYGQPQGLSLRLCVDYNLLLTVNYHISTTIQRRQQATALPRRRLRRIVRTSLRLSLPHYATPPFPQKSRSARLFGCKRPYDGSLSLPTFADCGQPQGLSLRIVGIFQCDFNQKKSLFRLSFNVFVFNCLSIVYQLFDFFF